MASKEFRKKPVSFTDLLENGRKEMPPCPDLRLQIRQRLSLAKSGEPDLEMDWVRILLRLASFARVQTGFGIAFAALMVTSYMELKRPDPQPSRPSPPPMLIEQMFSE